MSMITDSKDIKKIKGNIIKQLLSQYTKKPRQNEQIP